MAVFTGALHFGTVTDVASDPRALARVADLAAAAEDAGFDALFVPDHAIQNRVGGGPRSPMLEAYTFLGALAVRTRSARLGALVSPVTFRNPGLLAKAVTTLDVISGGRAILGLGAGWDVDEHRAYGVEFPSLGERMDRLDDALEEVCRALFSRDVSTVQTRHYELQEAPNFPRPLGPIPILVGGAGERRTLRAVARYADACNIPGTAETVREKLAVLESHCEQVGRDPAEITKTAALFGTPEQDLPEVLQGLKDVGVEGVVFMAPPDAATIARLGAARRQVFG